VVADTDWVPNGYHIYVAVTILHLILEKIEDFLATLENANKI